MSINLCLRSWKLRTLAINNKFQIRAAHITGYLTILADNLSRIRIRPSEWFLNDLVLEKIFNGKWEKPTSDFFASGQIHKIPWTWRPHPKAMEIDTLSISWKGMIAYAFIPICLIPNVLEHMKQLQFICEFVLTATQWPRRY